VLQSQLASQQYTLPEPGIYSIILEAADLANNTKYVRRLCLFDPFSDITVDPKFDLFASTASKVANFSYQNNISHGVVFTWQGHFRNAFHEENVLLGPVRSYPPQLGTRKTIPAGSPLEDHEGELTVDGIQESRGITNFQVTFAKDHKGGLEQPANPQSPPNGWRDVGLNTTFTLPIATSEGDTVTVWVKATDAVGNVKVDRTKVTFDSSPPFAQELEFHMNELVPGVDFSSRFELSASDDESGIAYVLWTFKRSNGSIHYQERVEGRRDCTDFQTCRCTPADDCFWFDQSYSFSNCHMMVEKENLDTEVITVTADVTNMAGVVSTKTFMNGNLTLLNGTEACKFPTFVS
ncbi:hypothetical protein BaRGS_00037308, partial [Batillaria attramentaria]